MTLRPSEKSKISCSNCGTKVESIKKGSQLSRAEGKQQYVDQILFKQKIKKDEQNTK